MISIKRFHEKIFAKFPDYISGTIDCILSPKDIVHYLKISIELKNDLNWIGKFPLLGWCQKKEKEYAKYMCYKDFILGDGQITATTQELLEFIRISFDEDRDLYCCNDCGLIWHGEERNTIYDRSKFKICTPCLRKYNTFGLECCGKDLISIDCAKPFIIIDHYYEDVYIVICSDCSDKYIKSLTNPNPRFKHMRMAKRNIIGNFDLDLIKSKLFCIDKQEESPESLIQAHKEKFFNIHDIPFNQNKIEFKVYNEHVYNYSIGETRKLKDVVSFDILIKSANSRFTHKSKFSHVSLGCIFFEREKGFTSEQDVLKSCIIIYCFFKTLKKEGSVMIPKPLSNQIVHYFLN